MINDISHSMHKHGKQLAFDSEHDAKPMK
jgi:hypothetical protein